jgi:phage protein U
MAVMAIIDSFIFELDPKSRGVAEFTGLDTTENFRYKTHQKIDAFDTHQDISKWGQKFQLKGDLILKKIHVVDPIAESAKKKDKVVFALGTGEVWMVIITDVKRGRSVMDIDGKHFRQSYTIEMTEVLD